MEEREDLKGHVVMIGFGRVGSTIARALDLTGSQLVVVELDRAVIDQLKEQRTCTVFGDGTRSIVLRHARVDSARLLIVASPGRMQTKEIISFAKRVNPEIITCVRTHNFADAKYFQDLGVDRIVMGELELGLQMARFALVCLGHSEVEAEQTIEAIRTRDAT